MKDWSIQEVARLAGTTSRTLRHYDDIGLLAPTRLASNGYRHYDERALVRLQRILLLRELGLGLPQISEMLREHADADAEASALNTHLALLREEQARLARQIASVESTITALNRKEQLMAEKMFDGFDHTQHRQEVEQRWGKQAYADGDRWWRGMADAERASWKQQTADLNRDWIAVAESGADPASDSAQEIARRHVEWLAGVPGTPAALRQAQGPRSGAQETSSRAQESSSGARESSSAAQGSSSGAREEIKGYVIGLGEMYVADPRFGANYATAAGGTQGAEFVRDALRIYADTHL